MIMCPQEMERCEAKRAKRKSGKRPPGLYGGGSDPSCRKAGCQSISWAAQLYRWLSARILQIKELLPEYIASVSEPRDCFTQRNKKAVELLQHDLNSCEQECIDLEALFMNGDYGSAACASDMLVYLCSEHTFKQRGEGRISDWSTRLR